MDDLRRRLAAYGQDHLLQFAHELSDAERGRLRSQIEGIDFDRLARLHRASSAPQAPIRLEEVSPIEAVELPRTEQERKERARAAAAGVEALLAGRVAAVLVAGGQGSRLGFDAPKGAFPIGPVTGASLFQFHAEKILARGRQAGRPIPWYIMTSPVNDAATREFFETNRWFGLQPDQVRFFTQGAMPAIDAQTGRVLMASRSELFLSPDGHGGVLAAMRRAGVLEDMRRKGCDVVFYFQVDNAFVDVADPTFIGQHLSHQADVSLKVIRKEHPSEKLGLVVQHSGRPAIVEYSDLPSELAERRAPTGELEYWTGSIAIHLFRRSFLERITEADVGLPFHFAKKKVPHVDASGRLTTPAAPNAVKFEQFVFDCLPMADRALIVETSRTEEYEPLKNFEGEHSPQAVRDAITRRAGRWLALAGIEAPRTPEGRPLVPLEISPLAGLSPDDFLRRVKEKHPVAGPTAWTERGRVSP